MIATHRNEYQHDRACIQSNGALNVCMWETLTRFELLVLFMYHFRSLRLYTYTHLVASRH